MKNIKLAHLGCMLSAGALFYSCKKSEQKVQLGQSGQETAKTVVSQGNASGNFFVLGTSNPSVVLEISKDLANFATHPLGYLHVLISGGLKNMNFLEWEDIVAAGYTNYSASVPMEIRMHPKYWNSPRLGMQKSGDNYNPAGASMSSALGGVGELTLTGSVNRANLVIDRVNGMDGALSAVQLRNRITSLAKVPGQLSNGQPKTDAASLSDLINADKFGFIETNVSLPKRPYTLFKDKPDSVVFFVKYTPQGGDKAVFEVSLHASLLNDESAKLPARYQNHPQGYKPVSEHVIGYTRAKLSGMHSNWTRVSAPIFYNPSNEIPEYLLINITAGDGYTAVNGSVLIVDKIEFIYN
jgi:hypothetical protein